MEKTSSAQRARHASSSESKLVTLSPSAAPGATLYNSYYFMTQLAGLYAVAAELETKVEAKKKWSSACDQILDDLSELYKVWEWALGKIRDGTFLPEDLMIWKLVALACHRVAVIHKYTNQWTSMMELARSHQMCEYRWGKILDALLKSAQFSEFAEKLIPLRLHSQERHSHLTLMMKDYQLGHAEIEKWFSADNPPIESEPSASTLKIVNRNVKS